MKTLLLCSIILLAAPALALDIESLDTNTIAALTLEGPLVVIDESTDGGLEMAVAATVIDAPPHVVWDTLLDFDSYPQWMPQVVECVADDATDAQRVETTLEFNLVITKKVRYLLEYRDQGDFRMEYSLVEGDFARNEGYWVVRPFGGGQSILYYANYVDYSSMNLLRAFLKRQPSLELALGASGVAVIVKSVKQRVEST